MQASFASIITGLAVLMAGCLPDRPVSTNGTLLDPPMELQDYGFVTTDAEVHISDFAGSSWLILAFGYTSCPDACPATMVRLKRALELVDIDRDVIQVLLVTVDPQRDTPEKLDRYVKAFNPSFMGGVPVASDSSSLYTTLGIYAEQTGAGEPDYLVDHTTATIVLNPEGAWRLVWNVEVTPEEMAADLERLL